jgi:hypothetical protein
MTQFMVELIGVGTLAMLFSMAGAVCDLFVWSVRKIMGV